MKTEQKTNKFNIGDLVRQTDYHDTNVYEIDKIKQQYGVWIYHLVGHRAWKAEFHITAA